MWNIDAEGFFKNQRPPNIKEVFDYEIEQSVIKGLSLQSTSTLLKLKFGRELGKLDNVYLEDKYVDCLNCYLSEHLRDKIKNCVALNNISEFLTRLRSVKSLEDFIDFINQFCVLDNKCNQLESFKQLCKNSEKVKSHKHQYLNQFKCDCLFLVDSTADNISGEICFVKCLTEFLKESKEPDQLCQRLGLLPELMRDFDKDVYFKKFLRKLSSKPLSGQEYKLEKVIQLIKNQDKFILNKNIKKSIESYLRNADIRKVDGDGRSLLVVEGKHIVLSKVIREIESRLSQYNYIEEVRFVNAGVIHVDASLQSLVWKGKNIVVYAETIIVDDDNMVTWDVSGKNALEPVTALKVGRDNLGHGLPGADGQSGESGGNILIMVDELKHADNLIIISKGGNGSEGGNGGMGLNGNDGHNLSEKEFRELYPPVSKFLDKEKHVNLETTRNSVLSMFSSVESFFYGQIYLETPLSKEHFEEYLTQIVNKKLDVYFKMTTENGSKVSFSFYYGPIETASQSFLLYTGPLGEEGKPGGVGGCGGKGGHAGEIEIVVSKSLPSNSVRTYTANGEEGESGKVGMTGAPGKRGVDRAYVDYSRPLFHNWPKLYTPSIKDDICLNIKYRNERNSQNVWCPHNDSYAEIIGKQNPSRILINENVNKYHSSRHEVYVQRKKAISKECIMRQYEQESCGTDLFKINTTLEHIKTTVADLLKEMSFENEHSIIEQQVIRPVSYFIEQPKLLNENDGSPLETCLHTKKDESQSAFEIIELICENPKNLENLKKLLHVRLNLSEVQEMWSKIRISNNLDLSNKQTLIGVYFFNKYHLAMLQELTKDLVSPLNITLKEFSIENNQQNKFEMVEHFFVHDSSEKRKEAFNIFEAELSTPCINGHDFDEMLIEFLRDFSHDSQPSIGIKLKEVNEFTKNRENNLLIKANSFKSALVRSDNKHIYKKFFDSIVKNSNETRIMFENEVQKDKEYLCQLYKTYIKAFKTKFNWVDLFDHNNDLKSIMINTFLDHGPVSSVFYRKFLAFNFKINIVILSINERNEINVLHNHNSTATEAIHFLLKGDKFDRLNKDSEMKMLSNQKNQAHFLSNVLTHMDSFITTEEFNEFMEQKPFLSEIYNGPEKSLKIHIRLTHIILEEENIKMILKAYTHKSEQDLLMCMLEKLKCEYTGCESILYYLALHFENEGSHISAEELGTILNFTLECALNVSHTIPTICWIVAVYPQKQWLVEIILMKIEFHCREKLVSETESILRQNLCNQYDRQVLLLILKKIEESSTTINLDSFKETVYLLSNIPQVFIAGLDQLALDGWNFYLKDKFWFYQLKPLSDWPDTQLKSASHCMVDLEKRIGDNICKGLVKVFKIRKNQFSSAEGRHVLLDILLFITSKGVTLNNDLLEQLNNTHVCNWKAILDSLLCYSSEDQPLDKLIELVRNSKDTSKHIFNILDSITEAIKNSDKIKDILEQSEDVNLKKWISLTKEEGCRSGDEFIELPITKATYRKLGESLSRILPDDPIMSHVTNDETVFDVVFAIVICAIEKICGIKVRATQKLAIVTVLKSSNNVLSQISTGEGKSLIIVVVAIIRALMGHKIDIITSSHLLAKRDAKLYCPVYNFFSISVGHNCYESIDERVKIYSNNIVVYGELANFQRDFLLDHVYNKNILGDRSFQTVIVDEVDSMLLDRGNNTLYLSHEIPSLDKLEPVFVSIWMSLNIPISKPKVEPNVQLIKNKIIHDLFGLITKEDLSSLDTTLDGIQVNTIFNCLVQNRFIESSGKILIEDCKLESFPEILLKRGHLQYLFNKCSQREGKLHIPNYLKSFVEKHLDKWVQSGIRALSMEPGIDYVIDVDRSDNNNDRKPNVIILDRDTGNDLVNSQWEEGLHQFLQLKHGCKLSLLSLKAVFISNVSYLKKYNTLFGLTGTLGSDEERKLLKETYKVDFVVIPPAKKKQFNLEQPPILCSSPDEWITTICDKTIEKINQNRSVLIVCETVNDAVSITEKIKPLYNIERICTYTRDYQKFTVAQSLQPGYIIVSTNLAGRGTNINLHEDLIKAGGLHVCLTFLPNNTRIEEQAFGRASRKGEPGSGQLIFKSVTSLNVVDLMKQRDLNENCRIKDIKKYYESYIKPEEECFEEFVKLYKNISSSTSHNGKIKSTLLQVSLDQWAFWVIEKTNSQQQLFGELKERIKHLSGDSYLEYVENPFQLVKLGVGLIELKKNKEAIVLFDRVIKDEPSFSASARYYNLCAHSALETLEKKEMYKELNIIAEQIKDLIKTSLISAQVIDYLKEKNALNILQIESFKEQKLNICNTYEIFLELITNITGRELRYDDFVVPNKIDHESASKLYNDLIKDNLITKPTVRENFSEKQLLFVKQYGLLPIELYYLLVEFKGNILNEQVIVKTLKESHCFPSRELFWKELKAKNILTNEEKYCIIDLNKLKEVDPSLMSTIDRLKITNLLEEIYQIWLYLPEEIGCLEKNLALTKRQILKETIGNEKYKLLKYKYVIYLNKNARISKPNYINQLNNFDNLIPTDFSGVQINRDIALEIISELEDNNVIKADGENCYILSINPCNIATIKLSRFKAYTEDVIQLLNNRFAFRIALEQTCNLIDSNMPCDKSLPLPLQIRIEKQLIRELYNNQLIQQSFVNTISNKKSMFETGIQMLESTFSRKSNLTLPTKEDLIKTYLQELYSIKMSRDKYETLFIELYPSDEIRKHIIDELLRTEVLKKTPVVNNDSKTTYILDNQSLVNLSQLLSPAVQCYSETILLLLQRHLMLSEPNQQMYISELICHHSSHCHDYKTPALVLCPLDEVLQYRNLSLTDCTIFALNGLDKLVILEEMKYNKTMIISTFVVAMLGIVELAVGTYFGSCNILEHGYLDLMFCVNAIFAGHFNRHAYYSMKLRSIFQSISSKVASKFGSNFGQIVKGSMTTPSVKYTFKLVAEEALKRSAAAIKLNIMYLLIENIVQPQCEKLGEAFVRTILSDVDDIVQNHPVRQTIKDIYSRMNRDKSSKLITFSCEIVKKTYIDKDDRDWAILLGKLKQMINDTLRCFKEFKSFKEMALDDFAKLYLKLNEVLINVTKCIQSGHTLVMGLTTKPSEMAESLQHILQNDLRTLEPESMTMRDPNIEGDQFLSNMLELWKEMIISTTNICVHKCVIIPLLRYLKENIAEYGSKYAVKHFSYHNERELNKLSCESFNSRNSNQTTSRNISKRSYLCSKYEHIISKLFHVKQEFSIFLEVLKNSASVDKKYVELCCSVIPIALKCHGIIVPWLKIVVDLGDGHETLGSVPGKEPNELVVVIFPNEHFLADLKEGKIELEILFDDLYSSFSKLCQDFKDGKHIRSLVIDAIEKDCYIQDWIKIAGKSIYVSNSDLEIQNEKDGRSEGEPTIIQDNSSATGCTYIAAVKVYLLNDNDLTHLENIKRCVAKGFKIALNKINIHLSLSHPCFKYFKLTLEDFDQISQIVIPNTQSSMRFFETLTTKYELIVPLKQQVNTSLLVDYKIALELRCFDKKEFHRPLSSHIVYEITPINIFSSNRLSYKGYVLLDFEFYDYIHQIKNCHSAGELIIPY